MQIERFNAWLNAATPEALERAERALQAGVRRVGGRYSEARLEAGRWHWMAREVIKKRGTRDYVADLTANGWAVATVYDQIRDWLNSQNYTLPVETLPDKPNPLEQQIKAAIEAARKAREGRERVSKVELNGRARIPLPTLYGTRDNVEIFSELRKTHAARIAEIFLDAFHTALLIDQFIYEEDIDVDFSMRF